MKNSKMLIIMIPVAVILLGLVTYQYGYLKIRTEIAALKEEQDMKTKILEKYINLISQIPQLEKDITAQRQLREFYNTELLTGETSSIAAAALQDFVKGIITSKGGKITSGLIVPPAELGKFTVLNVSINAAMPDVGTLSDAIYSIETHAPSLIINDMDVRIKDHKNPRELMIKLDVSALMVKK